MSAAAEKRKKGVAPPGEKDLGIKLSIRRVFWGMNYATRLNLLLGLPGSGRTADGLSDIDCVGFSVGGDFSIRLLIADCKSGGKVSPAARLFWLAGVRDFFGADRAYAVLARGIPDGVREQAGRLGLDVLGADDRQILENVHGVHAQEAPFFDIDGAVRLQRLSKDLDKRLEKLVRFRDYEYWHLPPERRIQRLLAALRSAGPHLDTRQRGHVVLVVDVLFLLALSLLGACRYVSSVSIADPKRALLYYLLGGAEQTRTREQGLSELLKALEQLPDDGIDLPPELREKVTVEPPYFDALAETVTRMLRRPRDAQRILRYLEWWGQAQIGLDGARVVDALGEPYGEYTRKLVGDIGRTCFSAAGLDRSWQSLVAQAGNSGAEERVPADAAGATGAAASQLPLGGSQ